MLPCFHLGFRGFHNKSVNKIILKNLKVSKKIKVCLFGTQNYFYNKKNIVL